jgi:hypothetical protein
MGEGGTIGAPAAIANALADALSPLGADVFELPMTSERLFRLFEKKRQVPESWGLEPRDRADESHAGHGQGGAPPALP